LVGDGTPTQRGFLTIASVNANYGYDTEASATNQMG